MRSKTMEAIALSVQKRWGNEQSQAIISDAFDRWKQLCLENQSVCKQKKTHLVDNILPCISYYEALQGNGISSGDALLFLDDCWSSRARKSSDGMKKMLGFCNLYKLYPAMFAWVAKHQFGVKAGFAAEWYPRKKGRCKFDMTQCFFLDTCKRYGCPELTQCFCHTDDINNKDLHPCLVWNRSRFMGKGDQVCDFDIEVRDLKTK